MLWKVLLFLFLLYLSIPFAFAQQKNLSLILGASVGGGYKMVSYQHPSVIQTGGNSKYGKASSLFDAKLHYLLLPSKPVLYSSSMALEFGMRFYNITKSAQNKDFITKNKPVNGEGSFGCNKWYYNPSVRLYYYFQINHDSGKDVLCSDTYFYVAGGYGMSARLSHAYFTDAQYYAPTSDYFQMNWNYRKTFSQWDCEIGLKGVGYRGGCIMAGIAVQFTQVAVRGDYTNTQNGVLIATDQVYGKGNKIEAFLRFGGILKKWPVHHHHAKPKTKEPVRPLHE